MNNWKQEVIDSFESWQEALDATIDPRRGESDVQNRPGSSFFGEEKWDDLIRLAKFGWPEGLSLMSQTLQVINNIPATIHRKRYDVAGMYPAISRAVAGNPVAMVRRGQTTEHRRPIVTVRVNRHLSGAINKIIIVNRGAALVSAIDELERTGYSVELLVTDIANAAGQTYTLQFPIKKAGEALDLDRTIFLLAHPGATRRMSFHLIKTNPGLKMPDWKSAGVPHNKPFPDDVYFRSLISDRPDWKAYATPESARTEVRRIFAEAGYSL